jgi:hypothetical protein
MLKKLLYCVIYTLVMITIYNMNFFKVPVRVQIIEKVKENRYRALDSPKYGTPTTYYINSDKPLQDWSFMNVYELSSLGNTLEFLLLMLIIITILEETALKPTPFNPYNPNHNENDN